MKQEVDRIVLTRPAVEAGEKLGFLPGHTAEGQHPSTASSPCSLHDMMDFDGFSN